MNALRSKSIAFFGMLLLIAGFFAFSKVFSNTQVFPKSNSSSISSSQTLVGKAEANAKANAQLQAELDGAANPSPIKTKPTQGSITFLDNQIGGFIQSKFTNSFSTSSGKIIYIFSNPSKTHKVSFLPLKVGNSKTTGFPYSLAKSIIFIEGSYHKGSWCLILRRGGVYQKSSNLDSVGSLSFGNLGCHNGK